MNSRITHPKTYTEEDIITGCVNKNRELQELLYDQYKNAMFTLCYRILNDFEEAEDVLQEGFIKVFQNIESFNKKSTLGAWIKTIILRTALKKHRKSVLFEPIEFYPNIEDANWNWDINLTGELLDKAINSLAKGYRIVFTLIEIEGYSHQEVADILGISIGTSKSQLYHAKKDCNNY